MDESRHVPRRRYWINPRLQAGFIVRILLLCAVLATVLSWTVLYVVWTPLLEHLDWSGTGVRPEHVFTQAATRVLATTVLLVVVFSAIAFGVGLFFSHRIAGPAYRLSRLLQMVAQGRFDQRAHLRRNDCLQELVRSFNEMLDVMEAQSRERASKLLAMHEAIQELDGLTQMEGTDVEAVRECVARLTKLVRTVCEEDIGMAQAEFRLVNAPPDADAGSSPAAAQT